MMTIDVEYQELVFECHMIKVDESFTHEFGTETYYHYEISKVILGEYDVTYIIGETLLEVLEAMAYDKIVSGK